MTKDEKILAFTMWLDGYSLAKIGEEFGVSRQAIYQMFKDPLEGGKRWHGCNNSHMVIYPNIRQWMDERDMPLSEFCRQASNGICLRSRTLRDYLTGTRNLRMPAINAVTKFTGMTVDTAFWLPY